MKITNFEVIELLLSKIENGEYAVKEDSLYKNGEKVGYIQDGKYIVVTAGYKRRCYLHRLLFAYYYGIDELKKYETINHKNGNKLDNSKENLEGMSLSENTKHAYKEGLNGSKRLEKVSKLTKENVLEIKSKLKDGVKQKELSKQFNISINTISLIKLNKIWKNI